MQYYITLITLLVPALAYSSETDLNTIFNARKKLAMQFLNLTYTKTYEYKKIFHHFIHFIKNDEQYIFRNNTVALSFPTSLYYEVDNEEICTTNSNQIFFDLLQRDRKYVQILFTLYTQNTITQEDITLKVDELIGFLHGYFAGTHE